MTLFWIGSALPLVHEHQGFYTSCGVTLFWILLKDEFTTACNMFLYALWRDVVWDLCQRAGVPPAAAGFYTPCGVTFLWTVEAWTFSLEDYVSIRLVA